MPHVTFFPGNRETRTRLLLPLAIIALLGALFAAGLAHHAHADTVTATIPVGSGPSYLAVDVTTNRIYVPNTNDNTVSVIDGATNAVTATIPVGSGPTGAAVDEATNTIYVTNYYDYTVSVINGVTNTVTATIPVGSEPYGVTVDQTRNTIYVSNYGSNTVSVIDGATNTVTATIPVGGSPYDAVVDETTNTIYVPNYDDDTVSVIDGATNTVSATIPVGNGPYRIALNETTDTIYVANYRDDTVSVIDGTTNTVTATIPVGSAPYGIGLNPATNTIYVTNYDDNSVSVINGATNTVTSTIAVVSEPYGVAVNPDTNTMYVANFGDNSVSVISLTAVNACTTICYVNGTTGSDTTHGGTSPGDAFATIQKAVDTVQDGGTVIVAAGTYNENVTIDKGITLKGYKAGWDARYRTPSFGGETIVTAPFIADDPNPGADLSGFHVTSNDPVTIDGFDFEGNYYGIYLDPADTEAEVSGDTIINDIFHNNQTGLVIGNDSDEDLGQTFSNLTVQHDLFQANNNASVDSDYGDGIWLAGLIPPSGSGAELDDSTIAANTFTGNQYAAIDFENGYVGADQVGVVVSGNSSTGDGSFLLLDGAGTVSITGNTVSNSTVYDAAGSTGDAIELGGISNVTVSGNTISGAAGAGILAGGYGTALDHLVIQGNTFSMNHYGMHLESDELNGGSSLDVTGNTFKSSKTAAIAIDEGVDTSGLAINDNSIAGNFAGLTNDSNDTFDATCNWWGSNSGPRSINNPGGYGDSISGLDAPSFVPWRTSSNLNFPCDKTAPTVSIFAPTNGATYKLRQNVRPVFSCADTGGSGVGSCTVTAGGSNYNVDTSTAGVHTFTVTTKDKAGNTATASVTYTVS